MRKREISKYEEEERVRNNLLELDRLRELDKKNKENPEMICLDCGYTWRYNDGNGECICGSTNNIEI